MNHSQKLETTSCNTLSCCLPPKFHFLLFQWPIFDRSYFYHFIDIVESHSLHPTDRHQFPAKKPNQHDPTYMVVHRSPWFSPCFHFLKIIPVNFGTMYDYHQTFHRITNSVCPPSHPPFEWNFSDPRQKRIYISSLYPILYCNQTVQLGGTTEGSVMKYRGDPLLQPSSKQQQPVTSSRQHMATKPFNSAEQRGRSDKKVTSNILQSTTHPPLNTPSPNAPCLSNSPYVVPTKHHLALK
jgi:hypothetical protein